jgi:hypothetical protein
MGGVFREIGVLLALVVGLAALAVVVSRNAQTPQVLSAGGQAFSNILNAAVSPVSGSYNRGTNFGSGFNAF